jgi:hypothetical protein
MKIWSWHPSFRKGLINRQKTLWQPDEPVMGQKAMIKIELDKDHQPQTGDR